MYDLMEDALRKIIEKHYPNRLVKVFVQQDYAGLYNIFGLAGNVSFCIKMPKETFTDMTLGEISDALLMQLKEKI